MVLSRLRRSSHPYTYVGLITSVLGLITSILAIVTYSATSSPQAQDVKAKLRELDRVRTALSELDAYVEAQQRSVAITAATLAELRRQKNELDKVVSVNAEAAEALLRYQEQRQTKRAWLGYAISFVLGVFSSLTATFLAALKRKNSSAREPTLAVEASER
jgi:predicted  nucleic acid-binding Zn-ribbon protein